MSSEQEIAVTGATGVLGGRVARRLADAGVPLRLVVRDPSRTPRLDDAQVAVTAWVTSYAAIANSETDVVSDSVERVTGHPPIDLREHLRTTDDLPRGLTQHS